MASDELKARISASAKDFILGVKPVLERQLKIQVFPLDDPEKDDLARKLDQAGIDAFYFDEGEYPRGLASRINYHSMSEKRPAFSFRYRKWNDNNGKGKWDEYREYHRKLYAANNTQLDILFPKLHVESFSESKSKGLIKWSFVAETRAILNYAEEFMNDPKRIHKYEPSKGERREVINIYIDEFRKENKVIDLRL